MELNYEKKKVDRIFKMIDKEGFIELFNQELKNANKNNLKLTQSDVFNQLNNEYYNYTGKYRYNNYESFKAILYVKQT